MRWLTLLVVMAGVLVISTANKERSIGAIDDRHQQNELTETHRVHHQIEGTLQRRENSNRFRQLRGTFLGLHTDQNKNLAGNAYIGSSIEIHRRDKDFDISQKEKLLNREVRAKKKIAKKKVARRAEYDISQKEQLLHREVRAKKKIAKKKVARRAEYNINLKERLLNREARAKKKIAKKKIARMAE